jgi:hypothetical protein
VPSLDLPPNTVPTQPQVGPDQLELLARIAALEARAGAAFIEPTPVPTAPQVVADPATLTPFQQELVSRTSPTPPDFKAESVAYNHAQKWFAKPDGMIVRLQGSPQALSHYLAKGFHPLSPAEVERWETVERPKVVKAQARKAQLINGLRRLIALNPQVAAGLDAEWDSDVDKMTIAELEEQWSALAQQSGNARVSLPRPPRLVDNETAAADRQLAGVETSASVSREEFVRKLGGQQARGQGRLVEMTPADRR